MTQIFSIYALVTTYISMIYILLYFPPFQCEKKALWKCFPCECKEILFGYPKMGNFIIFFPVDNNNRQCQSLRRFHCLVRSAIKVDLWKKVRVFVCSSGRVQSLTQSIFPRGLSHLVAGGMVAAAHQTIGIFGLRDVRWCLVMIVLPSSQSAMSIKKGFCRQSWHLSSSPPIRKHLWLSPPFRFHCITSDKKPPLSNSRWSGFIHYTRFFCCCALLLLSMVVLLRLSHTHSTFIRPPKPFYQASSLVVTDWTSMTACNSSLAFNTIAMTFYWFGHKTFEEQYTKKIESSINNTKARTFHCRTN